MLVALAVDPVLFYAVGNRLRWVFAESLSRSPCGHSALGAVKHNCSWEQRAAQPAV